MRPQRSAKVPFFAVAIFCGWAGVLSALGIQYTITDLGDLGYLEPGAESQAHGINNNNLVVGSATITNGDVHAFIYTNGLMVDLGTLLPNNVGESYAYGINDQGIVVGTAASTNITDAFYFTNGVPGAKMVDMGTLGGAQGSTAFGINNQNQIAGDGFTTHNVANPFLDSAGGSMQGLGDLNGPGDETYQGVGYAINDSGVVVGYSDSPANDDSLPFINTSEGLMALPLLGGDTGGAARGINSSGIIAGYSGDQAVFWSNSVVFPMGFLNTNESSSALGINDAGQIVGEDSIAFATPHAFIYMNGTMTDLNSLVAPGHSGGFETLTYATAINNNGAIAGYGLQTNGEAYFAFLAVPYVPYGPSIVMNVPVVTNKQVLLNFLVTDLTNATYHLLQVTQLTNALWTTNLTAKFTTNILNVSYRFTDTNNSVTRFYQVRSP